MADVRLSVSIRDELEDLPADTRDRVKQKLRDAGERPDRHLKPLQGRDGHRIRIGDYRTIVNWDRDDDVLYVVDFGHRRNIYD
jgi:mRNA interferase RelE/StbE